MSDVDQSLARIAALAPTVAGAHAEQIVAIADERDAEADILARALHLAAPAGRALASQIRAASWTSGLATGAERSTDTHARGLVLIGSPRPTLGREHGGYRAIDDWSIVWIPFSQTVRASVDPRRDGDSPSAVVSLTPGLYRVDWAGTSSHWQGSSSGYGSTWTRTPLREACEAGLDVCLASLVEALEQQAKADRPTKAATERAAKLRAVLALI